MKKLVLGSRLKKIGSIVTILALAASLYGCHFYDGPTKEIGNLTVRLNAKEEYAMAVSWKWSGDPDDTVIEIPEEAEKNIPIDSLGGPNGANAPLTLFHIASDSDANYNDINLGKYKFSTEKMVFTLKIGKNIEKVNFGFLAAGNSFRYVAIDQEDGSVIFYKVFLIVECDEQNEKFYSKDGKLYDKKNNSLVSGIPYLEDEAEE